jgi:hypothetical protein
VTAVTRLLMRCWRAARMAANFAKLQELLWRALKSASDRPYKEHRQPARSVSHRRGGQPAWIVYFGRPGLSRGQGSNRTTFLTLNNHPFKTGQAPIVAPIAATTVNTNIHQYRAVSLRLLLYSSSASQLTASALSGGTMLPVWRFSRVKNTPCLSNFDRLSGRILIVKSPN